MAPEVKRLIGEIRALPREDREALLAALSGASLSEPEEPLSEEEAADEAYQKQLLAAGLIREVRLRRRDQRAFEFTPIEISGEPLSQTIIEERR